MTRPDIVIVDIRMPPTHTDEGLVAARDLGRTHPEVGVLVLSHHLDSRFAGRLLEEHPERVGYLLKERLSDIAVLKDALHRIADGECVIDATIVSRLLRRRRDPDPLGELTEREHEVLGLMAEGRSNSAIAARLFGRRQDDRSPRSQCLHEASARGDARRPSARPRGACLPSRSPSQPSTAAGQLRLTDGPRSHP